MFVDYNSVDLYTLHNINPNKRIHVLHIDFKENFTFCRICFYFSFDICRELGRKEKESLQKMAEIAKEGFQLKQQLIQEAKRALEDKKV